MFLADRVDACDVKKQAGIGKRRENNQSAQIAIAAGAPPPATAAVPKASLNRAIRTEGMLTSTVLAVAVRAIATAENAKAVGSFTMAAVPRPCALPPCARPRAAGSLTLPRAATAVAVAMVVVEAVATTLAARGSGGGRTVRENIVWESTGQARGRGEGDAQEGRGGERKFVKVMLNAHFHERKRRKERREER